MAGWKWQGVSLTQRVMVISRFVHCGLPEAKRIFFDPLNR
jgi:hypothetical protein